MSGISAIDLAWSACTVNCRSGPCVDCFRVSRQVLCRLVAAEAVPFSTARAILDETLSLPPESSA